MATMYKKYEIRYDELSGTRTLVPLCNKFFPHLDFYHFHQKNSSTFCSFIYGEMNKKQTFSRQQHSSNNNAKTRALKSFEHAIFFLI